jgi:hypothetical protein
MTEGGVEINVKAFLYASMVNAAAALKGNWEALLPSLSRPTLLIFGASGVTYYEYCVPAFAAVVGLLIPPMDLKLILACLAFLFASMVNAAAARIAVFVVVFVSPSQCWNDDESREDESSSR